MSSTAALPPLFDRSLAETRTEIDEALEEMPENRLEARRFIAQHLGFDPQPEELQAIFRVAHHTGDRGPAQELSRQILAMRVLVDRELQGLEHGCGLDTARLQQSAEIVPELLHKIRTLEGDLPAVAETLPGEDRDFLIRVGDSLIPSQGPLVAASVLVRRLELISKAADEGDVRTAVPWLTAEERSFFVPGERREDGSTRICIDALAIRAVIQDEVLLWEALESCRDDDPAVVAAKKDVVGRLDPSETAYRIVSKRLQKRIDEALVARSKEADRLRAIQSSLFGTFVKVAPIRRLAETGGEKRDEEERERLFAESVAEERIAERARGQRTSKEELYLGALTRLRNEGPDTVIFFRGADELRRERWRIRLMMATVAVLFASGVVTYALLLGGARIDLFVPPEELPHSLKLGHVIAAGPMMYAEVSHWDWDRLNDREQLSKIEELGASVRSRGIETVYLADENNRELAIWTHHSGAKLSKRVTPKGSRP